jgi:uncharacterized iron-regulated membrane protein
MHDATTPARAPGTLSALGRVKRVLRFAHRWVALVLAPPLVLIGLSGSALIAQREIVRWTTPGAQTMMPMESVEAIVTAARSGVPEGAVALRVELPARPGLAAAVQFELSRRPQRRVEVLVDPFSLPVLRVEPLQRRGPVKQVLTDIHEYLLLPEYIGFPLVGWIAVAMVFLALSGLVLWWPRRGAWRRAFGVRRHARGAALMADLHHAVGIWGLAVFLAFALSGVYLVFPHTTGAGVRAILSDAPSRAPPDPFAGSGPVDADGAARAAEFALAAERAKARAVVLPIARGGPYVVEMERPGVALGFPLVMVTVEAASGTVTFIDHPEDHAPAERAMNLLYALHFAVGLGGAWTAIAFIAGLLPLLLSITGMLLWWRTRGR